MFDNAFHNKRVFVTGHTGFKGSWLLTWLLKLGAHVSGYSDRIPTQPSMFEVLGLGEQIDHQFGDVRDLAKLSAAIQAAQPDFVFHLAAQPIVSLSYADPTGTISTNVIGTMNVLEALRSLTKPCTAILITSDKCYENVEWPWGYKETDRLGGRDIYSGSKGAAEVIIHAYHQSFFRDPSSPVRLATARAGNVIGGGDWASDRIVADCMRHWAQGLPVEIRSPNATRPWQHVLEPLSGYLALAVALSKDAALSGESFNFGPHLAQDHTVLALLESLGRHWGFSEENLSTQAYKVAGNIPFHEAQLLKLNCDKAFYALKWHANLNYGQCVQMVADWYRNYYRNEGDLHALTLRQIEEFETLAQAQELKWTR